ncbi:hypothetical protein BC937DRAFT_92180 [Endogone sp. FLAS-F59071]|nr:hypothetical protein BC937DRAFT_92180 [Endogone sp. FLAS-F59071]|eukprot:RUS21580.1 hypothetical protein BC937DRAFT_92180 [Endogone sp. FLAS-F59071]
MSTLSGLLSHNDMLVEYLESCTPDQWSYTSDDWHSLDGTWSRRFRSAARERCDEFEFKKNALNVFSLKNTGHISFDMFTKPLQRSKAGPAENDSVHIYGNLASPSCLGRAINSYSEDIEPTEWSYGPTKDFSQK